MLLQKSLEVKLNGLADGQMRERAIRYVSSSSRSIIFCPCQSTSYHPKLRVTFIRLEKGEIVGQLTRKKGNSHVEREGQGTDAELQRVIFLLQNCMFHEFQAFSHIIKFIFAMEEEPIQVDQPSQSASNGKDENSQMEGRDDSPPPPEVAQTSAPEEAQIRQERQDTRPESKHSKRNSQENLHAYRPPSQELPRDEENLQLYLENQLIRYEKIQSLCTTEKDKVVLQRIIKTLESQIEKIKYPNLDPQVNDVSNFGGMSLIKEMEKSDNDEAKIKRNLKEIYQFYSRISYSRGPSDDFGRINYESHTLTEGKFIIFCRQFDILDERLHHPTGQNQAISISRPQPSVNDSVHTHKWWLQNKFQQQMKTHSHSHKRFSFKELNCLFRKHNSQQNEISFEKFCSLLLVIARLMFEESEQYQDQFYEFLQVKTKEFRSKLKSLSIPFNSKEPVGFRKPEGLANQNNYSSHKSVENKKKLVEQWREEKRQEMRDRLISQQNEKSYSKSQVPEPSYIKHQNYKERQLKKVGLLQKQYNQLDWEKLEKLNPKYFFDQEFNPNDLIDEQEDDDDKYYLKSYILKQQPDQQVNESIKIAEVLNRQQQHIKTTLTTKRTQRNKESNQSNVSLNNNIKPVRSAIFKLPRINDQR